MRSFLVLCPLLLAGAVLAAPPVAKKPVSKPPVNRGTLPSRGGFPLAPKKPVAPRRTPEVSQLPGGRAAVDASEGPLTAFQTNSDYDPRLDLKTDWVAVHKHGAPAEEIDRAIQSWKAARYPVHRMFFIGSDAGSLYTSGKADGTPHPDDVEMDFTGKPITVDGRPYMVPTAGWLEYLKGEIRRAVDSGAEGIWPEEPLLHAEGGYSPAFVAAWKQQYGEWRDQLSSPQTFFKSSMLKADLYLKAVDELARYTKEYAKSKNREVKFYLPVHAPADYAESRLIFPHAAASRLPIDGIVAQVWSGPARAPVTYLGKSTPQPFENSWMMYSYFANLLDGAADKKLLFLQDPVEDDPSFKWTDYERWYKETLAASLLFPQAHGYEVMPWPERVYLPGQKTAQGAPAPPGYLTQLSNVAAALKELRFDTPMKWTGGTRGIGVLTLDTMMWQRGGPQGSSMRSLHGLVLPLLKRGIPVEIVPGERAVDKGFLSRFKILLVSYDMQKPLEPEVNTALAQWVRGGGCLVVLGGEDAYNSALDWWSRSGFAGPTEHLLRECGAGVVTARRSVRNGPDRFTEVLKAEDAAQNLENRRVHQIRIASLNAGTKPVYLRFSDLYAQNGHGAWLGRVRVREGDRIRADFVAGSAGERPFLVEDRGSGSDRTHRFADRDAYFVYRFNRLGPDAVIELELGNQFRVSVATGDEPATKLDPVPASLVLAQKVAASYPVVEYPLNGAEPLYRPEAEDMSSAWTSKCGAGTVVYCGVPAAYCADSLAGSELITGLVKTACAKAGLTYAEGPIIAQRGPYVVAHSLGKSARLKGQFLDLLNPDLPVLTDPQLPYREPGFYKEVYLVTRIPVLLHASHRARVLEGTIKQMRLGLEGPKDTIGTARIYRAGMSVGSVDAADSIGRPLQVESFAEGPTLRVKYPQSPTGISVTIHWVRPEARLTK